MAVQRDDWLSVTEVLAQRRQPGLERWMASAAARLARAAPRQTPAQLTGTILASLDEHSAPARHTGIRVHALVTGSEAVAGPLTPDERAMLAAWEALVSDEGLAVVEAETPLCHPALGYKGRLDLVAERDGRRAVVEVKSGRRLHMDSVALQVAAYDGCTHRRSVEGEPSEPFAGTGQAAVVHLRPGRAEWLDVDLSGAWEAWCGLLAHARWTAAVGGDS